LCRREARFIWILDEAEARRSAALSIIDPNRAHRQIYAHESDAKANDV